MASTKTGERLSGPLSEFIGDEALRNTHSEAKELIPLTQNEVNESMSSVDGDQALSGHTQSLSADKSRSETGEHEENGVSSGKDLEDTPILENSRCEQDSIDNGREAATDKISTENPSLVYETSDVCTSVTDKVDQYVSDLPPETLHRVSQARIGEQKENKDRGSDTAMVDHVTKVEDDMARLEKTENQHEHQESPTLSGPDQSKSSQQHGLNQPMHADRLQNQQNIQLRVADAVNQVGAASNEFFEVPDTRGPSGPTVGGVDYALRDYQMQLMLLEQSNKRRLWMARQEQDGIGETTSFDQPEKSTVPAESAPQELPDTTVETRSCGGDDSSTSRSFKAHL